MSFFNSCGYHCCPNRLESQQDKQIYGGGESSMKIWGIEKNSAFNKIRHSKRKERTSLATEMRKTGNTQDLDNCSKKLDQFMQNLPPPLPFHTQHQQPISTFPQKKQPILSYPPVHFIRPQLLPIKPFSQNVHLTSKKQPQMVKNHQFLIPPKTHTPKNRGQDYLKPESENSKGAGLSRRSLSEFEFIKTESIGGSEQDNSDKFSIVQQRRGAITLSHLIEGQSPTRSPRKKSSIFH